MPITAATVFADLAKIRAEAPLVHNITNFVVMNLTANALLAIGASPVMAHALEEVEEMADLARALVLNIGTLSPPWVEAMIRAGRRARVRKIPIVLDPVGAGATSYRTSTVHRLCDEAPPGIVRGNASEIRAIAGQAYQTKGVDSTESSEAAADAGAAFAHAHHCVVTVSGAVDVIVSEKRTVRVANGHPMMARVTGLGCAATAITAAFAAVQRDRFRAAAHAMVVMGVAGEVAATEASGPGSFQVRFLDALATLSEAELVSRMRLTSD
jgi:hydroxyethylthiazole kinase